MGYRLIALAVISVIGVYYIAFDAVGIHLWNKPYTISVMLPAAGGIYTDAAVTYRGVEVGKVSAIELRTHDVKVDLAVDHGTRIPADVTASVKELTAAAEQYMDLVPANANPPYLRAGSVIAEDHTSVPTSVGTLLNSLNGLVDSLHASDLNTISDSLATGLQGAGTDLRSIINDSQIIIAALTAAAPSTVELINSGHTVLTSLVNTNENLQTLSAGLNQISAQLQESNSALIGLLQNGAPATAALATLLDNTTTATIGFVAGLSDTAGLANARQGAVQAFFQVLPVVAENAAITTTGGVAHFELNFNDKNTVCPYTSTMAEPTSLVGVNDLTRNCATTAPDMLQRGADTAPTPTGGQP